MTLNAFSRRHARLDRSLRTWFIVSLAICLAHWVGIMAFLVTRLGQLDFLYLHYTAEFGIDWMGPWYLIFTFPAFGLGSLVVNAFVAQRLQASFRPLAVMAAVATIVVQTVTAAAGAIAIVLNLR